VSDSEDGKVAGKHALSNGVSTAYGNLPELNFGAGMLVSGPERVNSEIRPSEARRIGM